MKLPPEADEDAARPSAESGPTSAPLAEIGSESEAPLVVNTDVQALGPAVVRRAVDVALAIAVGVIVIVISLQSIGDARAAGAVPSFYQRYFEPAIRMTCGQGFGVDLSGRISTEMLAFLTLERDTLTCDQVWPVDHLEPNPPTRIWYHLFATTALYWKVTGISWPAMDGLAALLLSLGAVFLYLMLRIWMPPPVAALVAVLSMRPALPFLLALRDLNKTPFILAALFASAWLLSRSPSRRQLFAVMAAIGGWIGFGYGFRPDVLIGLPLLAVTAVFFRPQAAAVFARGANFTVSAGREVLIGAAATLVMSIAFLIVASPMFSAFNNNVGNCHWHFALLGLTDGHAERIGMPAADYSILTAYSDILTWQTVESYGERVMSISPVGYCTPAYDRVSMALYVDSVTTFSGDFLNRSLLTAQQMLSFALTDLTGMSTSIQHLWILAWLSVILGLLVKNLRLGLFALFTLAYLCAYPVVQFDRRHYFHLAFVTWLPAGLFVGWLGYCAVSVSKRLRGFSAAALALPTPRELLRALGVLATTVVVAGAIVQLASRHQERSLGQLFESYLAAPSQAAVRQTGQAEPGQTAWWLPGPGAGSLTVYGRMLRVEVGGPGCTDGQKRLTVAAVTPDSSDRFEREFTFEKSATVPYATIFAPQYFSTTRWHIDHVELSIPEQDSSCLRVISWVDSDALPSLWVTVTLFLTPQDAPLSASQVPMAE